MLVVTLFSLLAASAVRAAPYTRRGLAQVIEHCNHDFAYTWDDGPYVHHTDIDAVFNAAQSHTTYFVNGANWGCIYDDANVQAIRASYEAGHQIAHHTWSHAHLTQISYEEIDVEIQRLNEAFVKILGVKPKYLRPPYGEINDDVADYLQSKYGLTIVTWDHDSLDSDGMDSEDWNYNYYVGLANSWDGTPILGLSHETEDGSVAALQAGTVTALRSKGIKLVTVAECLDDPSPYVTVTGYYGTRDDTWQCWGDWSLPTGTSTSSTPGPTCAATYTVPSATTCDAVAAIYGITSSEIQSVNSYVNCSDIWQGTSLCIPRIGTQTSTSTSSTATSTSSTATSTAAPVCVTSYTAPSATTCDGVASVFGINASEIQTANSFVNCADIWQGTNLCIPRIGTTSTSTASSSTSSAPPVCATSYTAPSATTCDGVAAIFGITGSEIQTANSFVNCADIWQGTNLCIPRIGTSTSTAPSTTSTASPACATSYTAPSATTCDGVAAVFGITGSEIQTANSFVNCADIWQGTNLCIPRIGTISTSTAPSTTSSAAPACATSYTAPSATTCDAVAGVFGITGSEIQAANTFVNCSDIWQGTPLCIPRLGSVCTRTITSTAGATCDTIASANGITTTQVQNWNTFLNCSDIWTGTTVCVAHT